jgi:hypothetical protein
MVSATQVACNRGCRARSFTCRRSLTQDRSSPGEPRPIRPAVQGERDKPPLAGTTTGVRRLLSPHQWAFPPGRQGNICNFRLQRAGRAKLRSLVASQSSQSVLAIRISSSRRAAWHRYIRRIPVRSTTDDAEDQKVPEGSRRFQKVPEGSRRFQKVPEVGAEYLGLYPLSRGVMWRRIPSMLRHSERP